MDWHSLKDEAARMLLEKDALHIYAALLERISTGMNRGGIPKGLKV